MVDVRIEWVEFKDVKSVICNELLINKEFIKMKHLLGASEFFLGTIYYQIFSNEFN